MNDDRRETVGFAWADLYNILASSKKNEKIKSAVLTHENRATVGNSVNKYPPLTKQQWQHRLEKTL